MKRQSLNFLLASLFLSAICGIVYELIIGAVSTYLLGNSVYQFSLTIGVFMFAMGIGSWCTKYFNTKFIENYVIIEILLGLFGGISALSLFLVFPYARDFYETLHFTLILIIGALVGMEIPILTTLLSEHQSTQKSVSEVMGFDYVGALVGSILFPLVLLPKLGLIQSSFLIGSLNIFVAFFTYKVFKEHLTNPRQVFYFLAASILLLLLLLASSNKLTSFAERHLYFDQIVYDEQTEYQKLIFTRSKVNSDHRLYIDGHIQFSSRDEYRYHEYLVHPAMTATPSNESILVLGGGDGLALREILKYDSVNRVLLVDIDPAMIAFGAENATMKRLNNFSYNDSRVEAIAEDAFKFLNETQEKFDKIIVDMPDPHNEAISKLYSVQFYAMMQRCLNPGGVVVTQSSSPFYTTKTFWTIEKTLGQVFNNTVSYHTSLPSFGIWGFHLASDRTLDLSNLQFPEGLRSIDSKAFASATTFPADIAKSAADYDSLPANSIMSPEIYLIYADELHY